MDKFGNTKKIYKILKSELKVLFLNIFLSNNLNRKHNY